MKTQKFTGFEDKQLMLYIMDEVTKPKAVVQIIHGMQEHGKRYEHFAKFLNKNGYIAVMQDLRGHGQSEENLHDLGKCDGDIFEKIVQDQKILTETLEKMYNLPVYIFGHSFGSFVTQRYIQEVSTCEKAVICGSAYGKTMLVLTGKLVANLTAIFKGKNTNAKLVEKMSFGSYAKHFENGNWLSRDEKQFEKYKNDKLCGTPFPASFYQSMFKNMHANYKHLNNINRKIKLLLISGKDDYVSGKNGKSVKQLFSAYTKQKLDVDLKLYNNMRHEILNETDNEIVYSDVLEFLNK